MVPGHTDSLWLRVKGRICQPGKDQRQTWTNWFRKRNLLHHFTTEFIIRDRNQHTQHQLPTHSLMYAISAIDAMATEMNELERRDVRRECAIETNRLLFQRNSFSP